MNFMKTEDGPVTELSLALPLHCNTPDDVILAHMQKAIEWGFPIIEPLPPHHRPAVIVGGGPSVRGELPRMAPLHRGTIFALNGAGLWLQSIGITPHAVILLDARPHNVKFIKGLDPRIILYLATQCHPDVFDAAVANGNSIVTWHGSRSDESDAPDIVETRNTVVILGGSTVGTRALRLVHVLGYREVHLFGYDSCYAEDPKRPGSLPTSHAYPQAENDDDEPRGCCVAGRWFVSTAWMIRQAEQFLQIAAALMVEGMAFHLYGDGLLQTMACEAAKGEQEAAVAPDIHPSAQIHENACVGDGVKIGARTKVWQFASVIRGTVLGEDCNVASGATLDGPRFGDRCVICHNVAMGPGFLFGNDVFVGPNVTICNDAWPRSRKDGFYPEKLREGQWTVVVKDGASIGANAVVLPGVIIGSESMIAAGAVVDRNVPDRSLFKRSGEIIPLKIKDVVRMRPAAC